MAGDEQAREIVGEVAPARVFVALKMAPEIAAALAEIARPLARFAVRPIAPADIHLTLVPPWNEGTIPAAVAKLRAVAEQAGPLTLAIRRVCYGPDERRPHLLWAECEPTGELAALHAALIQAFGQTDERPFRPHVTLARIRGNGARIARKQPVERELRLNQRVDAVVLMRSPPPGERGYKVLASQPLGGTPPA